MRLLIFLLFSLNAAISAFDFFSISPSIGIGNVSDSKDFDLGSDISFAYTAYTDFYYLGAYVSRKNYSFSTKGLSEDLTLYPILLTFGTSHSISDEHLDDKRYRLGIGMGLNEGFLSRAVGSSSNEVTYKRAGFFFLIDGNFMFRIQDNFYIGPFLSYRISSLTFKDEAFSGTGFEREYSGSGFSIGCSFEYYWGLF